VADGAVYRTDFFDGWAHPNEYVMSTRKLLETNASRTA
jgi:hypothetical protein